MTSALLPPELVFRALDSNGAPLAGGWLTFSAAGTSTPQAAYSDATGATPLANPLQLDANGQASFWLKSGLSYKINLTDAWSVQQAGWPKDNIAADQGALVLASLASSAAGNGDELLTVLQPFTGATARTQHAKNAETVSVTDFGTDPTGATDSTIAIQAALNAWRDVTLPEGIFKITNLTMPSRGGRLRGASQSRTILIQTGTGAAITLADSGGTIYGSSRAPYVQDGQFELSHFSLYTNGTVGIQCGATHSSLSHLHHLYLMPVAYLNAWTGSTHVAGTSGIVVDNGTWNSNDATYKIQVSNCFLGGYLNAFKLDGIANAFTASHCYVVDCLYGAQISSNASYSNNALLFDDIYFEFGEQNCRGFVFGPGGGNNITIRNCAFELNTAIPATQMVNGTSYTIVTGGTPSFTGYGAANNSAGTVFTAANCPYTGTGTVITTASQPHAYDWTGGGTWQNVQAIGCRYLITNDNNLMNGTRHTVTPPTSWLEIGAGASATPGIFSGAGGVQMSGVNFGGQDLKNYDEGTWTPTFNNLAVVGTPTYTGKYRRVGNVVFWTLRIQSTTTTASTANSTNFNLPVAGVAPSTCQGVNTTSIASYGVGQTNGATCYPPTWAATADVTLSGFYFA